MADTQTSPSKRRIPANLSLDPTLKAAAAQYAEDKGISLSEIAERLLAKKLLAAGYLTETDEGYESTPTAPEAVRQMNAVRSHTFLPDSPAPTDLPREAYRIVCSYCTGHIRGPVASPFVFPRLLPGVLRQAGGQDHPPQSRLNCP